MESQPEMSDDDHAHVIDETESVPTAAAPETTPLEVEVKEHLASLAEQVQRFHERSARQEGIIREMQNRITELQGDQVQALLKPAIQRFAGLHSQASEARDAAIERGESSAKDFAFFMTAIEDALGLIDLNAVGAAPGAAFDPAVHHAVSSVRTSDQSLDKTIHRVTRQGFTYSDATRVALPAQVVVYRYDDTAEMPSAAASEARPTADQATEGNQEHSAQKETVN